MTFQDISSIFKEHFTINSDLNFLEDKMFEITNVTKIYGKSNTKAVDSLTMNVKDGEIFGFLGPNGAGKTTLIKMLTGIIQPTSGDISIDSISMKDSPVQAKKQFAFVPDNPETFVKLRAIEYLNFICDVYQISQEERTSKIDELCTKFGIKEVINNRINSFSHGMKQKLFLIASLVINPQNWILDEPMVGLDPEAAFTVKEIMKERAANGKTIFFSTHVMEVAEKICDRVGIICKGKLLFVGTLDELMKEHGQNCKTLEDVFLKLISEE